MSSDYLHPDRHIQKHGDKLPHWQQDEVMQFVTFRLGDALPRKKVIHWKEQRRLWLLTNPKPWDEKTESEYHARFTSKIEVWLDQGTGSCLFKEPEARSHLAKALMRFQGERVLHHSWIIMPNHVHVLFSPRIRLPKLIETWKSVSARAIGKGPIWQRNYRDTLIGDADHFINAVRYIRRNPVKAKLEEHEFTLWQGDRAAKIP